ncbi:putative 26S proteasome regulatory subunit RPN12 [Plasmodium gaboni]|uniref:Putative 26S proteasome regulatory subunit RPN12 n=1 Tax=Plasmodium gaboni TaxID=647221 RepID=A0A151LVN2_9APIC|nr:putative 26S proteasome regulatory subunit RPN12 [Plasmodium gaboni]KYO03239.1 putative 26S proteasome regulatory subunit RPN12 [Plasmodium gaboni]
MSRELEECVKLFKDLICCYNNINEKELIEGTNNDLDKMLNLNEDISIPTVCDINKCKEILCKLKLLVIHLPSLNPLISIGEKDIRELLIVREILEKGVIISIRDNDIKSFNIYIAQLFIYYFDYKDILQKSKKQNAIIGLYLLYLLAYNSIGDFHMTLEILSLEDHNDIYIKYVLTLEQNIMDGFFHHVLTRKEDIPLYLYESFMQKLYTTIRFKLIDCILASTTSIHVLYICELLKFSNEQNLYDFIIQYNETKNDQGEYNAVCEIKNNYVVCKNQMVSMQELPSLEIINNSIGYATELERIV